MQVFFRGYSHVGFCIPAVAFPVPFGRISSAPHATFRFFGVLFVLPVATRIQSVGRSNAVDDEPPVESVIMTVAFSKKVSIPPSGFCDTADSEISDLPLEYCRCRDAAEVVSSAGVLPVLFGFRRITGCQTDVFVRDDDCVSVNDVRRSDDGPAARYKAGEHENEQGEESETVRQPWNASGARCRQRVHE